MEEPTTDSLDAPFMMEAYKGNVRIRVHEYRTDAREVGYLVDVAAWNAWAGQAKLLFARGGLNRGAEQLLFEYYRDRYRGYDWHEGEFVLEENQ